MPHASDLEARFNELSGMFQYHKGQAEMSVKGLGESVDRLRDNQKHIFARLDDLAIMIKGKNGARNKDRLTYGGAGAGLAVVYGILEWFSKH